MTSLTSELRFRNYSMWVEKKHDDDWYDWCVFVEAEAALLGRIELVEYRLHPTFPDPVRRVKDREHRFALLSSGWGPFTLGIDVRFVDGQRAATSHGLTLERQDWPLKPAPQPLPEPDVEQVYRSLIHEKYRWRKVATLTRATSLAESQVRDILADLERADLARCAPFRSIDRAELWGATSKVGVLPRA